MQKKLAVIFDIDGTIADCTHRKIYVDGTLGKKDWKSFYENMQNDLPKENVMAFCKMVRAFSEMETLFVSGRPDTYIDLTMTWALLKCGISIPYKRLFMRKDGDYRSDTIVKEEIYKEKIEPFYDVKLVLDDRSSVVKMWRSLGLECWQVAEGDF